MRCLFQLAICLILTLPLLIFGCLEPEDSDFEDDPDDSQEMLTLETSAQAPGDFATEPDAVAEYDDTFEFEQQADGYFAEFDAPIPTIDERFQGRIFDGISGKACSDCEIGSTCYEDGEANPSNVCEFCDVAQSTTQWSNNDDEPCQDNLFCNGMDFCMDGACSHHTNAPCGQDGSFCNGDEYCDEVTDTCGHENVPDCADDGKFCTGVEYCNEEDNKCDVKDVPKCSDGDPCNGLEYCDEENDKCSSTDPPDCSDDGKFCNGVEYCEPTLGICMHKDEPQCADDGNFCNGIEHCDNDAESCIHGNSPCTEFESCNEDSDQCIPNSSDDEDDPTPPDSKNNDLIQDERNSNCCGC